MQTKSYNKPGNWREKKEKRQQSRTAFDVSHTYWTESWHLSNFKIQNTDKILTRTWRSEFKFVTDLGTTNWQPTILGRLPPQINGPPSKCVIIAQRWREIPPAASHPSALASQWHPRSFQSRTSFIFGPGTDLTLRPLSFLLSNLPESRSVQIQKISLWKPLGSQGNTAKPILLWHGPYYKLKGKPRKAFRHFIAYNDDPVCHHQITIRSCLHGDRLW